MSWTTALEDLRPREAYVQHRGEALTIRTVQVPTPQASDAELNQIVERYRERLLRPARQVMAKVDGALRQGAAPTIPIRRIALSERNFPVYK